MLYISKVLLQTVSVSSVSSCTNILQDVENRVLWGANHLYQDSLSFSLFLVLLVSEDSFFMTLAIFLVIFILQNEFVTDETSPWSQSTVDKNLNRCLKCWLHAIHNLASPYRESNLLKLSISPILAVYCWLNCWDMFMYITCVPQPELAVSAWAEDHSDRTFSSTGDFYGGCFWNSMPESFMLDTV